MSSLLKTSGWIVKRIDTGEAVAELYSPALVAKLNTDKYVAVPALLYLQQLAADAAAATVRRTA